MSTEFQELPVSIVIPTYCREAVLIHSVSTLLKLRFRASEILIIDQSPSHEAAIANELQRLHAEGLIRLIVRQHPSITEAMNFGLLAARNALVLFLDDDIEALDGLIENHYNAHRKDNGLWATVGQVIQPWQKSELIRPLKKKSGLNADFDFPFNSEIESEVTNVMAGNLCVDRERAISIGGFDERYVGVAYRFEADFARRIVAAGGRISFIGSAGINHLKAEAGGTRSHGNYLTSASPMHGFGDYYYAFRHGGPVEAWSYSLKRFFREVRTRFHLTHPWWIPVKWFGEARAIFLARRAIRMGPKFIRPPEVVGLMEPLK